MGQTEITIFIILVSIIVLIFGIGIIVFVIQYRKRKLLHQKEKATIEERHQVELLNTQLLAQEQTMQFIGREIHDSVAQKLTLAAIYTQKLEYENELPGMTAKLKNISTVINDSLLELRDLSKTLTDNKMHDTSLQGLLDFECERVNETGICRAELESAFDGTISVTVKSFLLRIIQEFIQNSLKHSEGKLIRVRIEEDDEGLLVTASDNGKGFDCENIRSRGIGLTNMERRVQLIGGNFNLQSETGKGTRLLVHVPAKNLMSK
jgi:signal transduction histidine kinase